MVGARPGGEAHLDSLFGGVGPWQAPYSTPPTPPPPPSRAPVGPRWDIARTSVGPRWYLGGTAVGPRWGRGCAHPAPTWRAHCAHLGRTLRAPRAHLAPTLRARAPTLRAPCAHLAPTLRAPCAHLARICLWPQAALPVAAGRRPKDPQEMAKCRPRRRVGCNKSGSMQPKILRKWQSAGLVGELAVKKNPATCNQKSSGNCRVPPPPAPPRILRPSSRPHTPRPAPGGGVVE